MSIGAASSRSNSASSSITTSCPKCLAAMCQAPGGRTSGGVQKSVEKLWTKGSGLLRGVGRFGELRLECGDTRLEGVGLVLRGGGHRLHHFELVAADEIETADPFLGALARGLAAFACHPGHGARGTVHELDEIVEQAVVSLHW